MPVNEERTLRVGHPTRGLSWEAVPGSIRI